MRANNSTRPARHVAAAFLSAAAGLLLALSGCGHGPVTRSGARGVVAPQPEAKSVSGSTRSASGRGADSNELCSRILVLDQNGHTRELSLKSHLPLKSGYRIYAWSGPHDAVGRGDRTPLQSQGKGRYEIADHEAALWLALSIEALAIPAEYRLEDVPWEGAVKGLADRNELPGYRPMNAAPNRDRPAELARAVVCRSL